jgi:hypothetical protein
MLKWLYRVLQFGDYGLTGYLVIEGFASRQEIQDLKARAEELVEGFNPASTSSVFSTRNQARVSLIRILTPHFGALRVNQIGTASRRKQGSCIGRRRTASM